MDALTITIQSPVNGLNFSNQESNIRVIEIITALSFKLKVTLG
jgi:hypothetical protein